MRPPVLPSGNQGARLAHHRVHAASMRPPVLPSGNAVKVKRSIRGKPQRFNEAAGFTQRKHQGGPIANMRGGGFNEAAGFTQRKLARLDSELRAVRGASMRPPVLPSGNLDAAGCQCSTRTKLQ